MLARCEYVNLQGAPPLTEINPNGRQGYDATELNTLNECAGAIHMQAHVLRRPCLRVIHSRAVRDRRNWVDWKDLPTQLHDGFVKECSCKNLNLWTRVHQESHWLQVFPKFSNPSNKEKYNKNNKKKKLKKIKKNNCRNSLVFVKRPQIRNQWKTCGSVIAVVAAAERCKHERPVRKRKVPLHRGAH